MTKQYPDYCIFQGEAWQIRGISEQMLPKPVDFGMETSAPSSTCWRGYIRVFSCESGQLVLDTLFVETDDPQPVNGRAPYLSAPEKATEALDDMPKLSGGQSIFADFKQRKVRFSHDVLGVVIGGFSCIYTKLDLEIPFTGKLLLHNKTNPLEISLYRLRRTFVDNDALFKDHYNGQDPMKMLADSMLELGEIDEEAERIFASYDSISEEFLNQLGRIIDSHAILLEFEEGKFIGHSGLTVKQLYEELTQMRRMMFFEYQ
ncbi:MAG: hypothetical protein ACFE7R_10120 [Candidatus Hodarchaeota archaeon]